MAVASSWLDERLAQACYLDGILMLAPTRGAGDDLLAKELRRDDRSSKGAFNLRRITPRRFAADIALEALASSDSVPILGIGLEALAARAVDRCRSATSLEYFTPVADSPGFPRALARTLEELRLHDVDSRRLLEHAAAASPTQAARARDLSKLLLSFAELLAESRLVDPPAVLQLATKTLESGSHRFSPRPLLLLDLALDSPLEARFIQALGRRSTAVLATAQLGDEEAISRLEKALGTTAESLQEGPQSRRLERLRRNLFTDSGAAPDGAGAAPDGAGAAPDGAGAAANRADAENAGDASLAFLSAAGENRECAEIARRIQEAARRGVPFDSCAVALRDPETYLPLIEEAFSRAGIRFHATRGTRRPDPAGRAFLALLACAGERLSASRFAEYLSLGQLPEADATGAPPRVPVPWVMPQGDQMVLVSMLPTAPESSSIEDIPEQPADAPVVAGSLRTPRRWERLLVNSAVIEGRDRWRRRLAGVRNERLLQLRRSAIDGPERRGLQAELAALDSLSRFALPLIETLDELPQTALWGEWLERLEALAARAVKEPQRILETLAELRPMAEIGPIPLAEVQRVLEQRLATLRSEPEAERWGHVLVAKIDELRGHAFDLLFLPGLAEGRFPRRASEDPLLPDADRQLLATELPRRPLRVLRERRLLRIATAAASTQLVFSYPSLDPLEGRARVPSFYALDLLRAAEGRFPDLRRLERQAAAAASSRLGWPAPRQPSQAIDDAEFDLATLLELISEPAPAKGSARYLLETNPRLRRSLRNRYARWTSRRFSAADGLVSEAATDILGPERLNARSYSPTALQNFATCPYKFLLYAILRLRPRETVERLEQLDPLTRGALFHEVVFEFLGRLRSSGLLPMRSERHEELGRLADRVLDQVARRYAEELAPAIERVWKSEIEALRLDLRGWIRDVIQEDSSLTPARFELAFGLPKDAGHDPASSENEVEIAGGRRLRGSIDLVEIDQASSQMRVTDYKTGRPPHGARHLQVGGGEILQPLLYALVAEQLLDQQVISGRLFYSTRRGGYQKLDIALDEEGRDAIDVVLGTVDGAIETGFLPALPRVDGCRFCDFRAVCGPDEERRTANKRWDDRLSGLRIVRGLP